MAVRKLSELFDLFDGKELKTIVAVCANDTHTIEAIAEAVTKKIVKGVLIGDESVIHSICRETGIETENLTILHEPNDLKAARLAVDLINRGEGDILMKGLISTDKFMRSILHKETGLVDSGNVVSHVTIFEIETYHKLLIVGDVAVIPLPDLPQKIQIIKYLSQVAHRMGIAIPKVAVIAPTEHILLPLVSTTDAAILAKMNERGQIPGCVIDGPLALDVAIDAETAIVKGLKSVVAGDADCLLFPNLESGNVFYKVNTKLGKAESAAIMVGARVPVVLASRGDSSNVKLLSIALGALMANS